MTVTVEQYIEFIDRMRRLRQTRKATRQQAVAITRAMDPESAEGQQFADTFERATFAEEAHN